MQVQDMTTILFEAHATSLDNESHKSSGHFDVELSKLGISQAKELGERYANDHFDAIFCSDLQRSYKTAELAFNGRYKIIRDPRLRECDYGDYTRRSSDEVDAEKANRISQTFPNGESYEQAADRMRSFLEYLLDQYKNKRIMIIGHRATQYGLEHWINGVSLEEVISTPWKWQPGWTYELSELQK